MKFLSWASSMNWSERSACDQQSNLGRPLFLVINLFLLLATITQCVVVVVKLTKYRVIKTKWSDQSACAALPGKHSDH